jgi:hypothetical protein
MRGMHSLLAAFPLPATAAPTSRKHSPTLNPTLTMRIFEPFFTPRTPPVTPSADHEHRVSATPSEHKLKEEATVKSVPILSRDSRQYHANIIVKV